MNQLLSFVLTLYVQKQVLQIVIYYNFTFTIVDLKNGPTE
jgi:hypothetical protein